MKTIKDRKDMTTSVQNLLGLIHNYELHWYSIIDFVRGRDNPSKPFPKDWSGLGCMKEESSAFISNILHYLLNESYIEFKEPGKFILKLSKRGIFCWKEKKPFYINPFTIRRAWGSYLFEEFLLDARKKASDIKGVPVYEIAPKFVVEYIAIAMPKYEEQITALPIWLKKYETDWVMSAIKLFSQEWNSPIRKSAYPSYQETKTLFCAGKNPEEIALLRKIKRERVMDQLITLHQAKEIDLTEWANTYYEKQKLERIIDYFQNMKVKLLKPAYETLNIDCEIDYETLKIGRLLAQSA